ncbi:MAG TPA: VOC family protein [Gaiellaceae bacterium]|nr:VOC family protein [Gaiellaceae bacterium]
MQPKRIDHVAFWVAGRDAAAAAILARLPWHVIDRQENFTLLGGDARGFKLTLFDAEGPREPGAFVHVALRAPAAGEFDAGEGLRIRLVRGAGYALDHVALRTADPAATAAEYERYGFKQAGTRAELDGAFVELVPGDPGRPERPLVNHLAVLVDSADAHVADAEELGIEVESVVDAANTYAAFLRGPDGVRIEYVEHKPTFSLT